MREYDTSNFSRGVDDLSVTPNPRWGGFNVQPPLYQVSTWFLSRLETMNLSKPLSTRVVFHHSGEVNTKPLTTFHGSFTIFFEELNGKPSTKPSRRRQPSRVTNQECLLDDLLVPQSSMQLKQCTRMPHTLKNAMSKQRSEWGVGEDSLGSS